MKAINIALPNRSINKILNFLCILLLIWVAYLLLLFFLQLLGLSFGYKVWPLGEDRNWMNFIIRSPGPKMTQAFWQIDGRNPLSAWWWLAISKLVINTDYGLYAVRKLVDPFLAVSTYLLLNQLARGKNQIFCFSVALTVLLWNFNAYHEQIIWEFLITIGLNLLCIYFYCRYVDSNRLNGSLLAASLILYLIAISTYTLQSGAPFAIASIAYFRQPAGHLRDRFKTTIVDTSFYLALFITYTCIWYTVSQNKEIYYAFDWNLFAKQFIHSIREFIFHDNFYYFWQTCMNDWSIKIIVGILVSGFSTALLLLNVLFKNKNDQVSKALFLWVSVILIAIAFPTIILESTSIIWVPGTRSPMTQQVWQPLLYIAFVYLFICLVPFSHRAKNLIARLLVSALLAFVLLLNLNYNYHLVLRTYYQKNLKKGIKSINVGSIEKPYFLLKFTRPYDADLNTIPITITNYVNSMLPHKSFFLRVIPNYHLPGFTDWRVQIGEDSEGAKNAAPLGDSSLVPYKNLWIIYFDGEKVWVPKVLYKDDFAGLEVDWNRKSPLHQAKLHVG